MKNNKVVYNAVVSIFSQIIIVVAGFLVPRLFIHKLGSDVNGLLSAITQIYTYVALIEAGVAAASKNILYKPIAEGNKDDINKVMSIASSYYTRITIIYYLIVTIISFILPFVINTNVDKISIFVIAQLEGISNAVVFLFCEKWMAFLSAEGKQYVEEKFNLITRLSVYFAKLIIVYLGFNIYMIQMSTIVINLGKVLFYNIYIKKKYPWIKLIYVKRKDGSLPDRNSFAVNSIAWTIFSSTDTVLISIMFSTMVVSVYAIYNMIFYNLSALLEHVYVSLLYVLGTNYNQSLEKYKDIHDRFEFVFISVITVLMSCSSALATSFIRIYIGETNDISYIDYYLPFLLGLVQMISWYRYVSGNLAAISGHAKESMYYSVVESFLNISLSVILGVMFGVYGIVLASVVALTYKMVKLTKLANKIVLKRTSKQTIINVLVSLGTYTLVSIYFIRFPLISLTFLDFFGHGILILILVILFYLVASIVFNRKIFISLIAMITKGKSIF